MPDVNAMLANLEKTWSLKARLQRQAAAEALAKLNTPAGREMEVVHRRKIEAAEAEAVLWEARAAEARNGYFLARQEEMRDAPFVREFGDVLSTCQAQGRVVNRASGEDAGIQ